MMTIDEILALRGQTQEAEKKLYDEIKEKAAILGMTLVPMDSAPTPVQAKYSDGNGNQWSGRGRKPQWVLDMEAQGRTLESLMVP